MECSKQFQRAKNCLLPAIVLHLDDLPALKERRRFRAARMEANTPEACAPERRMILVQGQCGRMLSLNLLARLPSPAFGSNQISRYKLFVGFAQGFLV
jgi:hypothetical protein